LDLEPAEGSGFSDTSGNVFEYDIESLAAAGIARGCAPSRFCPDVPVTRGQMAAFLHRGLAGTVSTDGPSPQFTDVGGTFAADIDWLGRTGITRGCNPPANTRFCPGDAVTRG